MLATCLIRVGLGHKLVRLSSLALLIMSYCVGVPPHVAKDGADVTCSQHRRLPVLAAKIRLRPAEQQLQHALATRLA